MSTEASAPSRDDHRKFWRLIDDLSEPPTIEKWTKRLESVFEEETPPDPLEELLSISIHGPKMKTCLEAYGLSGEAAQQKLRDIYDTLTVNAGYNVGRAYIPATIFYDPVVLTAFLAEGATSDGFWPAWKKIEQHLAVEYGAFGPHRRTRFLNRFEGGSRASRLALLYPLTFTFAEKFSTSANTAQLVGTFFSQLGYSLVVAGIFSGTFRVFRLTKRWQVFVSAAILIAIGILVTDFGPSGI